MNRNTRTADTRNPIKNWITAILSVAALLLVFRFVIQPSSAYQLLNEYIRQQGDGSSILEARGNAGGNAVKSFDLTAGQSYGTALVEKDAVNVLMIGPDASSGSWDTLMVASVLPSTGEIRVVNLPRDIYIDYSQPVKDRMKEAFSGYASSKGIYKINAAHVFGRKIDYLGGEGRFGDPELDFTADLIEEVFDMPIDDYMLVNPSGFRKVVDYFGGVDLEVPYRMNYSDPTQDLVIDLQKGIQHLNGAQAEGFVRFRQGYDANGKYWGIGDFERKNNQVAFMKAFAEQHLTPSNIGKFVRIFDDLDSYVEMSIDGSREVAAYAKMAEQVLRSGLKQTTIEIGCESFKQDGVYYLRLSPGKTPD